MINQQGRPIRILMIEDSPSDILMAKEALADSKILNNLHVVTDGARAMSFLRKQEEYADAPRPDLIFLDLNLPIKSGFEVLAELKNDESLKHIPVVVLTSSKEEEDIVRAYDAGANCLITKPDDFHQFCELIQDIAHFWFTFVTFSPRTS